MQIQPVEPVLAVESMQHGLGVEGRFDGYLSLHVKLGKVLEGLKKPAIVEIANSQKCKRVIIGGEDPFGFKHLMPLIDLFLNLGFFCIVETPGTLNPVLYNHFIRIIPSKESKPAYSVHKNTWPMANEFIYRVGDDFDFSLLDRHEIKVGDKTTYSLTALSGNSYRACLQYAKEHPKWKLNQAATSI